MDNVLGDVRVLDFSTLLPGPMATLFMADAGAEIIKIEDPYRGDEMRHYVPRWGDNSANFNLLNKGKKSIALDLKCPTDFSRLKPLIESADIVVEQFRPGVMARLGLSYEDIKAIKPDIIYCSISGYGKSGPRALRAGHDLNYQGDTGLLSLSYGPTSAPVVPPALIADIAAGSYPALFNILLALRQRDTTGQGAYLDIAMAENLFPFTYWAQAEGQVDGDWPGNGDALVTGGSPRYRLYITADRRLVAAAPIEQKFWETFCDAIGLETRFCNDARDPKATMNRVAELIAGAPSAHWNAVFDKVDCCCSVVKTLAEAINDPHFKERGIFTTEVANQEGEIMAALPTPVDRQFCGRSTGTLRAPLLGEHTKNYCDIEEGQ